MFSFRELLKTEGYAWDAYFYRLESKPNRTSLENALLRSYKQNQKPIDICCCDTGPVKNCGPDCCSQVKCFHCASIMRICKDAWFCHDNIVMCMRCKPKI